MRMNRTAAVSLGCIFRTTMLLSLLYSFLAGAAVVAMLVAPVFVKMHAQSSGDPLLNPRNRRERKLIDSVRRLMYEWSREEDELDERPYATHREAMKAIEVWSTHPSLWMVEGGFLTLPNGSKVNLRRLMQDIDGALIANYLALDDAASRVLDHAEMLAAGELEKPGEVLYSRKYAYESEIVALAKILGLDPDKNDTARYGGAELWRRQQERIFPHLYGRRPELALQH